MRPHFVCAMDWFSSIIYIWITFSQLKLTGSFDCSRPLPVVLPSSKGQGLQISAQLTRQDGQVFYSMLLENNSQSLLDGFMIQFNKNSFGLAAVGPLQVLVVEYAIHPRLLSWIPETDVQVFYYHRFRLCNPEHLPGQCCRWSCPRICLLGPPARFCKLPSKTTSSLSGTSRIRLYCTLFSQKMVGWNAEPSSR